MQQSAFKERVQKQTLADARRVVEVLRERGALTVAQISEVLGMDNRRVRDLLGMVGAEVEKVGSMMPYSWRVRRGE